MSLEDRLRSAAENILQNSSLGDDLMDDEAQVLLDWGIEMSQRFARRTGALDDSQADPIMDSSLTALRRTMRRAGRLVGQLPTLDVQEAEQKLAKLLEGAADIPGIVLGAPQDLQAEIKTLMALTPGEALRHVLAWFAQEEDASDGKA